MPELYGNGNDGPFASSKPTLAAMSSCTGSPSEFHQSPSSSVYSISYLSAIVVKYNPKVIVRQVYWAAAREVQS